MEFHDYSHTAAFHEAADDSGERSRPQHQQYSDQLLTPSALDPTKLAYLGANGQQQMACDIKPRLTKEQHDILEAHYQRQNKPNTNTKKGFAESLNVSLDKVNNWFQNRRAKSKQDLRKQQGTFNLYQAQQQAPNSCSASESETSPAFSSPDYFDMMQQYPADDYLPNALGISRVDSYQEQGRLPLADPMGMPFASSMPETEQFRDCSFTQHMSADMFDNPQELNRRTLTQEHFDAIAQNGGMLHESGDFNQSVLGQMFPGLSNGDSKQQFNLEFAAPMGPPQSSYDSTVPSTVSEQSFGTFANSSKMQEHANMSATCSDWDGSRSSSVSVMHHEDLFNHASLPQHQPATTNSTWQPGSSVPVDFNARFQEFRQAAAQAKQSPQAYHQQEQSLAWPVDEAYQRRDSQTSSMLAQSMRNVDIHTPQPQQHSTFKSPAPPSSIAARRQRQRPAPLGLASMRSQSHSGTMQPGSPSQAQQLQNLAPGQPLRRIQSSNMINGVAQGRIQKQVATSAQRSPLSWTFTDAMNSPKAARHAALQSGSTLAPPTPLSPSEYQRSEQARQLAQWQSSSGHVGRQVSISESDPEHGMSYVAAPSGPPQNFSSPPHTPMYHQQQLVQQRVGNNVITENTPPQSAPASQQCFPASTFAPPPQPVQHQSQPMSLSPAPQQQVQAFVPPPQQQMVHQMTPDQHYQMVQMSSIPPNQPYNIATSTPPMEMTMQFAPQAIPIVNAQGQLQMMAVPQNMQFTQQPILQQPQVQQQSTPQQMHTPPNAQFSFATTSSPSPGVHVLAPSRKPSPQPPAPEFVVHEYSPPQDIKRAASPRKGVDTGPKNYTFANQTPEHFEKGKKGANADGKPTTGTSSLSPASAASAS